MTIVKGKYIVNYLRKALQNMECIWDNYKRKRYYNRVKNEKKIVLIGTPEHGNLGDHLIANAEIRFLQDKFPNYHLIEVTGDHFRRMGKGLLKYVSCEDIIVITGGGFLGSLWLNEEYMVRNIIQTFSSNKVIIFPSTIYYEQNDKGNRELEISRKIYSAHYDLSICIRDSNSFEKAKYILSGKEKKILLVPDIALYLEKNQYNVTRTGVLLCFRKDKEKIADDSIVSTLKGIISNKGEPVKEISTVVLRKIPIAKRKKELLSLISAFASSKVIITDRLHGMIFATITGTPCIALDNVSGKVKGVYSWIAFLDYIKFVEKSEDISYLLLEMLDNKGNVYSKSELDSSFELILELFK